MEYYFKILTTDGVKYGTVISSEDLYDCPFGAVAYRARCSCERTQDIIDEFWRCIDEVLVQNNLTSSEFVRAMNAIVDGITLYGELE